MSSTQKKILEEVARLILSRTNPSIYRINLNTGIHKKTIKRFLEKCLIV